jgi:membrane protein DedA with SNARE-associated domain
MKNNDIKKYIAFIITLFVGMFLWIIPLAFLHNKFGTFGTSQFNSDMIPYFILSFIGFIIIIIGIIILPRKNSTTKEEK